VTSFDMGLWIGIGCQRGVSKLAIQQAIKSVFTKYNLDLATVVGLATVNRKANEPGLVEYWHESGWLLNIYSLEQLKLIVVAHPSPQVAALVGMDSVAEAAALCAAQTDILLVSKQKFQLDCQSGSVTIAIAQA
jgi:cobalamin biosynthesis protein CbiG